MKQNFVVRRPGIARSAAELDAALMRLRGFEPSPALDARWLRSYAVREDDGGFGLVCVFEADDAWTLRRHAKLCETPAQEIVPIVAELPMRAFAPTLVWLVRRRGVCDGAAELERLAAQASRVADEQMPRSVSWLHSYAIAEGDGRLGLACLYQAVDAAALHEHARRCGLPIERVEPVIGRIVLRDAATAALPSIRKRSARAKDAAPPAS